MKKITVILGGLVLGAAVMLMTHSSQASIIGSKHDFSNQTNYWAVPNAGGSLVNWTAGHGSTNVCGECHTIHHAMGQSSGPLWKHTLSSQTFKTYDQGTSETYPSAVTAIPGSSSVACLSCHDGSVAINSSSSYSNGAITNSGTGANQAVYTSASAIVVEVSGAQDDLTHMHPIGVSYTAASAALPSGSLNDVGGSVAGVTGGTIQNTLLKNGNVECSSCHDIHRTLGTANTSGIYTIASGQALCLTCHNK
jgi:predicted CXXCH cytochrome family protein